MTNGEEVQGGTPDDVLKSNERAVRGLVGGLAKVLYEASNAAVDGLGEEGDEYYGALKSAADTLWSVLRDDR